MDKQIVQAAQLEELAEIILDVIRTREHQFFEAQASSEVLERMISEDLILSKVHPKNPMLVWPSLFFHFITQPTTTESSIKGRVEIAHTIETLDYASENFFFAPLEENDAVGDTSDRSPMFLYNVAIKFEKYILLPFRIHGNGWRPSTCHSQFGSVIGVSDDEGFYRKVLFTSTKYQQVKGTVSLELVEYSRDHGHISGKRERVPTELSLPASLTYSWLSFDPLNVTGFCMRAADLEWGDGEFVQLVRHLGLGIVKPTYSFEPIRNT